MNDKSRKEFEAFVSSQGLNTAIAGGLYRSQIVCRMWQAWLAAKEKYEPRWISCEDSLPEDGDCDVLAFWDHGGMDIAHAQAYAKWYLRAGVTHWMPLPSEPSTQGGGE